MVHNVIRLCQGEHGTDDEVRPSMEGSHSILRGAGLGKMATTLTHIFCHSGTEVAHNIDGTCRVTQLACAQQTSVCFPLWVVASLRARSHGFQIKTDVFAPTQVLICHKQPMDTSDNPPHGMTNRREKMRAAPRALTREHRRKCEQMKMAHT